MTIEAALLKVFPPGVVGLKDLLALLPPQVNVKSATSQVRSMAAARLVRSCGRGRYELTASGRQAQRQAAPEWTSRAT